MVTAVSRILAKRDNSWHYYTLSVITSQRKISVSLPVPGFYIHILLRSSPLVRDHLWCAPPSGLYKRPRVLWPQTDCCQQLTEWKALRNSSWLHTWRSKVVLCPLAAQLRVKSVLSPSCCAHIAVKLTAPLKHRVHAVEELLRYGQHHHPALRGWTTHHTHSSWCLCTDIPGGCCRLHMHWSTLRVNHILFHNKHYYVFLN